jgi:hypothetical protein
LVACTGNQATPVAEGEPTAQPTSQPTPTTETVPPITNSTPTTIPDSDQIDIVSLSTLAGETPEDTFDQYLVDAVAQQVSFQREKLDMRIRYQNPAALAEDMGGLILDIEIVENRSRRTILRERDASFDVEIDIRVEFADRDQSTQTCRWTVLMVRVDELWYVTSPAALSFTNCLER